ncbi:MAG: hypothetical protein KKD18_01400 [Nanoarchaeota archaeon]|nr:hypothetical protein [Nanoarchaeota archaeon]MBU0977049.1 hypothetical protein [Nanoarchaeota archaeon]
MSKNYNIKRSQNKIEGRTKNYWIKLRRDKDYFDVLAGKRGKEPHIHFGINPDFSYKFIEPRGKAKKITRERTKQDRKKELVYEREFGIKGEPQFIVQFRFNSHIKDGNLHTYLEGLKLIEKRFLLHSS